MQNTIDVWVWYTYRYLNSKVRDMFLIFGSRKPCVCEHEGWPSHLDECDRFPRKNPRPRIRGLLSENVRKKFRITERARKVKLVIQ